MTSAGFGLLVLSMKEVDLEIWAVFMLGRGGGVAALSLTQKRQHSSTEEDG